MNNYIELEKEKLKKLHEVQVEILDEIVRICEKNNIKYFLTGGTLLGAIRHKGFIPWDDDLDIAMLRKDYEKFLFICSTDLSNNYMLDNNETNKKYWLTFSKIRKKNTLLIEKALEKYETFKGIYVDIFVLDNIPKEKSFMQRIQVILIKSMNDALFYKNRIHKSIKNYGHPNLVRILSFIPTKSLFKFDKKLCMKYDNKTTPYITNFASPYNYKKEILLKDEFFPLATLEFEGKKYNAPKNPNYYLKKIYGNYMVLPPIEKRVNHEILNIVFDTNK